jgi:hypothetical protein
MTYNKTTIRLTKAPRVRMIGAHMTADEGRQFDEILSHGSMLNVSEKFLMNLVLRLETEVDRAVNAKLEAVRDAQHRCGNQHQQKQKAIAALRTVLARIKYAAIGGETCFVADWAAPMPGRDDGLRNKTDDLADKAQ